MQLITSSRNPKVKRLRSLRHRKYRQREGCFLAEGIRIVEEALDSGAQVETLMYAPDLLVSERARALVERVTPDRRLALAGDLFRSLSDRDEPQGLAVEVRIEERSLSDIPVGPPPAGASADPGRLRRAGSAPDLLVLVACQLRDPGNLGSIVRTADAAGATGVVIVEPSVDLYDPQTVRATMGSLFALPIVRLADEEGLIGWFEDMRRTGLPLHVVASSARGETVHYEADYRRPVVLLVGSERHGLSSLAYQTADITVRLPMVGRATSLNVSAATAALVYEILRQRQGWNKLGQGGLPGREP